jgi:hypothetical protein
MRASLYSVSGFVLLFASLASGISCGRPSPVSPSVSAPTLQVGERASAESAAEAVNGLRPMPADATFPLLAGSFTIQNGDGDGIAGTYSGATEFVGGAPQKTSLTLQVSNGSGTFAGAAGTLAVTGVGSFAGSGAFALDGSGEVRLAGGKRAVLVVSLRGNSVVSCNVSGHIAIGQTAAGVLARAGRVEARLSHVVGNTGCAP